MDKGTNRALEKQKYLLNLILIAGLCSMTLAPCVIFYTTGAGEWPWLLLFLGIGYFISRLPRPFYDKIQISKDIQFYQSIGVATFKRFSTNGDNINRKIREKFPSYRNVTNLQTIQEKWNETYTIEKSHTVLFVFCLLTTIHALWTNSYVTAMILFIGNILFNLYPNLLQQYNRLRYGNLLNKFGQARNTGT